MIFNSDGEIRQLFSSIDSYSPLSIAILLYFIFLLQSKFLTCCTQSGSHDASDLTITLFLIIFNSDGAIPQLLSSIDSYSPLLRANLLPRQLFSSFSIFLLQSKFLTCCTQSGSHAVYDFQYNFVFDDIQFRW